MHIINNIPEVKICGIKTKEEIEIINRFEVSYIGFIFAKSKRQVSPERVKDIRKYLRNDIKVVGVFVDETSKNINNIINECKLDIIQLHGTESVDTCKNIIAPVWKSISVKDKKDIQIIDKYNSFVQGILLDTYHPTQKGGTGETFDWKVVRDLSDSHNIILAGGLNKDNIIKAINMVRPKIVDINSGVETNLIKDELKLKELFINLRRIHNE